MKKIYITGLLIVAVLTACIIGISIENHYSKDGLSDDENIVQLPVSDIESIAAEQKNGITEQEAEELCRDVLGDRAEENGFPISYRCIDAVSANDKFYYVMHISWLVNNSHWSYIGNCFVSIDGQEIYDGIVSQEEYKMTQLRWKK